MCSGTTQARAVVRRTCDTIWHRFYFRRGAVLAKAMALFETHACQIGNLFGSSAVFHASRAASATSQRIFPLGG
jgi:hypothetical protein